MAATQLFSLATRSSTVYSPLASALVVRPANAKAMWLYVRVSAIVASPLVTPKVRMKDTTGNGYILWAATAAIGAVGLFAYYFRWSTELIAQPVQQNVVESVDRYIPEDFDLEMTHADADDIDYEAFFAYVGFSA